VTQPIIFIVASTISDDSVLSYFNDDVISYPPKVGTFHIDQKVLLVGELNSDLLHPTLPQSHLLKNLCQNFIWKICSVVQLE